MSITVKIEGLDEIADALKELPHAVGKDVMRKVLMTRAETVVEAAKTYAPVRTGRLRDSIRAQVLTGGAGKAAFAEAMRGGASRAEAGQAARAANTAGSDSVVLAIGPKQLPYSHLVEFGSIHNPKPNAFMRRAWDSTKDSLLDGIKQDLWAEIRKAVGRLARKSAKG